MRLCGKNIEDLPPYVAGKPIEEVQRELGIEDPIKLASNENALGPSPAALAALAEAGGHVHRYPDPSARALKEQIAALHGVSAGEVVVGNGSNELIDVIVRTFAQPDDEGLVSEGTFIAYPRAFLSANVPFRQVPLRGLAQDLDAFARAAGPRTKVVFLANPNNPTGLCVEPAALERFLGAMPTGAIVVLDEAYAEYVRPGGAFRSALEFRARHPHLMVLRTFSKIHGLAGLRMGYGIGPAELVSPVDRVRLPFNASALAQAAAIAALRDAEHLARSRDHVRQEEPRIRRALTELRLEVPASDTNFLFVDVRRDAEAVFQSLLRHGVIVRPLAPYGFPQHLRITLGTRAENDRMVAALAAVLA